MSDPAKCERDAVTIWLAMHNPDVELVGDWPVWRGILFAFMHPRRFGAATALAKATAAVYAGEHLPEPPQ